MARFIIQGGRTIGGVHRSPGNKNAALPMLAACILTSEPVVLRNLPLIEDVFTMLRILEDLGVTVVPGNILGLRYREVRAARSPVRSPPQRSYDYAQTTVHLEEAIHGFETILAEMLEQASYEGKLKRLGEELLRLTRRIRVLEERIMPEIDGHIRTISQSLGERDREAYYLLKRFKAGGKQDV